MRRNGLLLLFAVASLVAVGFHRYDFLVKQKWRCLNRLETFEGVGILILVVAPIAEPAGMSAITGSNGRERLG